MAYTETEQRELWDAWLNQRAVDNPEWAEEFVRGIIKRQKELGLIGPQRPIPPRLKLNTLSADEQGEGDGAE